MKKLPQISQAEFEVMQIVWEHEPISTNEIVERLSRKSTWSPKTIQTMLIRLEKKGVLTHDKESRVFIYSSLIKKDIYIADESHSFLNRFYSGTLNKMVTNLLDQDLLSEDDLKELRAILDKKQNE